MKELIALFEDSILDNVLVTNEKKELKSVISESSLTKRELDVLRSEVFNIARRHQDTIPAANLIDWIEKATKLTLNCPINESYSRVYFSPGNQCRDAIIHHINQAKETMKICLFTISDNEISRAILSAKKRGVHVKIVTDDDKVGDLGSDVASMAKSGIPVKIDGKRGHMHHKFCVIDNSLIITGSYNWTNSAAERNYENILVNTDIKVVNSYIHEFNHLWENLSPL